jgi:hypothetical protein
MRRVKPSPARERLPVEPMQYESARFNDLWGAALFPGADGWTVIQTAPLELLGERAEGSVQRRLSALCRALAVPAIQFNVYDDAEPVLAEVAPGGNALVSGANPQSRWGEPLVWNDQPIDEANFEAGFRLLPFADAMPAGSSSDRNAATLARRFGGVNARYCDKGRVGRHADLRQAVRCARRRGAVLRVERAEPAALRAARVGG